MTKRESKRAEAAYLVRFTESEDKTLRQRAESRNLTVASVLRAGVGFPPMEHGGARQGAGRPPGKAKSTKPAKKSTKKGKGA